MMSKGAVCTKEDIDFLLDQHQAGELPLWDYSHDQSLLGQTVTHSHLCVKCGALFSHTHPIRTEAQSRRDFDHLCKSCKKKDRPALQATTLTPFLHPFSDAKFYTSEPETTILGSLGQEELFDVPDTGRFKQLGFTRRAYRPSANAPDHVPSIFSSIVPFKNECRNAPSSLRDVKEEFLPKLSTRAGKPSLLGTQIQTLSFEPFVMDEKILNSVVDFLAENYPSFSAWRPLNDHEIKNGVTDSKSPLYGYLNGLDCDKSAGFFGVSAGFLKKGQYFDRVPTPGGGFMLKWAKTPQSIALKDRFQTMSRLADQGEVLMDMIEARAKSELLPSEKVDIGKVRLFENVGLASFLLHKQWNGAFVALANKYRIRDGSNFTIGMNPYTETGDLLEELLKVSDTGEDGDFSRYDKRIPLQVQFACARLKARWAHNARPDLSLEYLNNVFSALAHQNSHELHTCEGVVYVTNGSFNSGCLETNLDDGIFNIIMRYYILLQISKENKNFLSEHGDHESLRNASKCVRFFVNGDDIITAIHPNVQSFFNFHTFKEAYAKFGMVYDLTTKDGGTGVAIKPVLDFNFSSRSFIQLGNSVTFGALKKSTIERLFHWTTNTSEEQYVQNFECALLEALFHGKDYYNKILRAVRACRDYWLQLTGTPLKIELRSYAKYLVKFLNEPAVEWLISTGLLEEYQSILAVHAPTMSYLASRSCSICHTQHPDQRSYVRHCLNSHPRSESIIPCSNAFCTITGTAKEIQSHRCEFSGPWACLDCTAGFDSYLAAANHHRSAHQRNAVTLGDYFGGCHGRLSLKGSNSATEQSQGNSHSSAVNPESASPAAHPATPTVVLNRQPISELNTYRSIVQDLVNNHVALASKVARLTQASLCYVQVREAWKEGWLPKTVDRFRYEESASFRGTIKFESLTIRDEFLWDLSETPVFQNPVGFFITVEPELPVAPSVTVTPGPGVTLSALETFQSSATPLGMLQGPAGGPSSTGAQLEPTTTATAPVPDLFASGAPIPAMSIDTTPSAPNMEVFSGPPPDFITLTGPRFVLEDAVYNVPHLIHRGTVETSSESGSVFGELVYGVSISPTLRYYMQCHRYFTGSFTYNINFYSNAAVSGAIIIGWQPVKKATYTINDLMSGPHQQITLQGTTTTTIALNDIRQTFYRETSKFFLDDDLDQRPRLVMMVLSQLTTFTTDPGGVLNYHIYGRPTPGNFFVNRFTGFNASANQDVVFPGDFYIGKAALVADSNKGLSFNYDDYNEFITTTDSGYNRMTDLALPTSKVVYVLEENTTNGWYMLFSGYFPDFVVYGNHKLSEFMQVETFPISVGSFDPMKWTPSIGSGFACFWDNQVPTSLLQEGSTMRVIRFVSNPKDSPYTVAGVCCMFPSSNPDMKFKNVVMTTYGSLIAGSVVTTFSAAFPDWRRALFSTRPEFMMEAPDGPCTPNEEFHNLIIKECNRVSAQFNENLIVFDVYNGATSIGQLVFSKITSNMYIRLAYMYAYCDLDNLTLRNPLPILDGTQIHEMNPTYFTSKDQSTLSLMKAVLKQARSGAAKSRIYLAPHETHQAMLAGLFSGMASGIGQAGTDYVNYQRSRASTEDEQAHNMKMASNDWFNKHRAAADQFGFAKHLSNQGHEQNMETNRFHAQNNAKLMRANQVATQNRFQSVVQPGPTSKFDAVSQGSSSNRTDTTTLSYDSDDDSIGNANDLLDRASMHTARSDVDSYGSARTDADSYRTAGTGAKSYTSALSTQPSNYSKATASTAVSAH